MKIRPRIAVFGSVHMDLIAHAETLPEKARSGMAHGFSTGLGGKGGNQAVECAAAGAETFMVTRLGDDEFGRSLLASLRTYGVDCSGMDVAAGAQSGCSTVLSAPGGYTSLIFPGAAAGMKAEDAAARVAALKPLDMLLLQLELPESLSLAAAWAAKEIGARIVLNASPPRALNGELGQLLAVSDIVVVNESEALALAGTADVLAAAKALSSTVVITRGAAGSSASDGAAVWNEAAAAVVVRSTVGAGDAFLAGLCVAICKGQDLPPALLAGARAAERKLSS